MSGRRRTDAEIHALLAELAAGISLPALCRKHGVSEATVYRWRTRMAEQDVAAREAVESAPRALRRARVEATVAAVRARALGLVVSRFVKRDALERAARLIEVELRVSRRRARRILGLAPAKGTEGHGSPPAAEPARQEPGVPAAGDGVAPCKEPRGGPDAAKE